MEPPYEEQYSQEGNPRAYMTMRDYRNLACQNQQPWERNPNPPRSMRDYRDHWMSAPSYIVPPQYISTPQPPQPPQLISPVEQAILDLTKLVGDVVEEQKKINAQLSQKIDTMENNVNKRIDGFQSEIDQKLDIQQIDKKLDIQQESILKLTNQFVLQEEENLEEECLTETILVEQAQLQPQEELKVELVEAPPKELQDALESGDTFWPWKKEEQISALISEEGSGKEIVEDPQKHVLQPIPTNPTANAKTTYSPLPVYILPTPAEKSKPAAPAPKAKSNPLHVMQNFKELVANVQASATTSKKMAAAYIAWHSGWFWCGFGFGASEPRHF